MICQLCETPGHSARTCSKINNNQQSTFQYNNYNSSNRAYEYQDRNRNGFLRTNHQNGSNNNYRGNPSTQRIKCEY